MYKLLSLGLVLIIYFSDFCEAQSQLSKVLRQDDREKRLLFYDEEGNLVKTYTNPYLRDFPQNAQKIPFFGNFLNPFIHFMKPQPSYNKPSAYMIPVSDEVVQQSNDPMYQNKLMFVPKDSVIEPNPLCVGKRIPIPSPKFCNTFLNCWDGWAFEQECPDGLLFSNEGFCDYSYKVDCSSRKLKDEPDQQKCGKEFEAFQNNLNCNEFFVCINHLPIKFKCPSDLHFSERIGVCDYPDRVQCGANLGVNPKPSSEAPSNDEPQATEAPPSSTAVASGNFAASPMMLKNAIFNTQTFTSSHIAMSRQDAIRQLQLGRIANVNTA